ncbi:hypothetical protein X943_001441 [Babesia divergens]|uniref:Uncharacterized protein n=1 Tax=Babesia divergens TaxID=32595 RepID=A0AAD9GE79_BABDI|nr:hypothetical protein X943_001441 [Babesia divergens]
MDTSYHIANLSRALDIVAGLVKSYDQIDAHISNLRFLDASQLLRSCYSDITSLSTDGELEEEIQVCCASLRSKCLNEVIHWSASASDDFLSAELEGNGIHYRLFEASCDVFDVTNCNGLYEGVLDDIKNHKDGVVKEANQLVHRLKQDWLHRYELLVKVALFVACRWLTFDEPHEGDAIQQILKVKDKERSMSYHELEDCLLVLNMSDTYLRLIEQCAERYIETKVQVSSGYENDEASSVDYVYDKVLGMPSQRLNGARVIIDGFTSTIDMVETVVQRIVRIRASLGGLIGASVNGASDTTAGAHLDYSTVDILSFKCLSRPYLTVLTDDLVCKVIDSAYICWEVECRDFHGLLQTFNKFCLLLRTAEAIDLDSPSRFVAYFFKRVLRTLEEHVLIFTRAYARPQSDDVILNTQTITDAGISRVASIREVDKSTVATLLCGFLGPELEGVNLMEVLDNVDWPNKIESCCVSNDIYLLVALLFNLASRPAALLHYVFGSLGNELVSQSVMATSIETYSHIVDSMLTTYLVITQDAFKQFVLGVTRVLSKDEDAVDLMALKGPLVMFLLFLSNVALMSRASLMLPYFSQELYRSMSSVVNDTYDNPGVPSSIPLSQVLKRNFHTCGSHVNMLKVQDYLLTQFAAFVQQILQKLFSRLLNGLNEEVHGFGEDALQLCTIITSLCDRILPKTLSSSAVALVVDLYFTTVPDLFLDYLDLLSYQPSDAVLHTITAFVVDIENALLKCMMGVNKDQYEMVHFHKFRIFAGVFQHDFSYLDDPNPPYNHRDLGRLSKMCKCIQSRAINMST